MTGQFDENVKESWYFGGLTFDESKDALNGEDVGVFLIRDSARGGFVLCVREHKDVAQYPIKTIEKDSNLQFFIRDELAFRDMSSLLAFYKWNLFESTALVRPISKESVDRAVPRARGNRIVSEIPAAFSSRPTIPSSSRLSAPARLMSEYARVIKSKNPSAYSSTYLELHVGDVIRITHVLKDGNGEGELRGKHGRFPLTHVEFIERSEANP